MKSSRRNAKGAAHQKVPASQNAIRIIAGKWKRRSLAVELAPGLRPTGNRIRETLFNWLAPHIDGAHCLDAFAGTGALGIEALSRGAAFVQFIEQNRRACQSIKHSLQGFHANADSYSIANGDALNWLPKNTDKTFNLVFLDPPFTDDLWHSFFDVLEHQRVLASGALIYVECPLETKVSPPKNWHLFRQLRAGQISVQLFERI